jgi:cephalosporin hydroxylase
MAEDRSNRALLTGDALKDAASRFAAEVRAKIDSAQDGVATFWDVALLGLFARLEQLGDGPWEEQVQQFSAGIEELRLTLQRLQHVVTGRAQGRFVDYQARVAGPPTGVYGASDIQYFDLLTSQGVFECLQWRGRPLFKSVYDFSIYPMLLWTLRPATIVELGSGAGTSAVWFADLARTFSIDTHIYSVDLTPPAASDERVTFIAGDCRAIRSVFDERVLREAPHPWVVVEDAHVNVLAVLDYFDDLLSAGDYLVVEDSAGKQEDLQRFIAERPNRYKVDTYYTDFFGRNATSARDSILVRA